MGFSGDLLGKKECVGEAIYKYIHVEYNIQWGDLPYVTVYKYFNVLLQTSP